MTTGPGSSVTSAATTMLFSHRRSCDVLAAVEIVLRNLGVKHLYCGDPQPNAVFGGKAVQWI